MRRAVECCRPAFFGQMKDLPRDIPTLAMGKWAYFALTGKDKGVMNARGFIRKEWVRPADHTDPCFAKKGSKRPRGSATPDESDS